jgi:hypothetical protein
MGTFTHQETLNLYREAPAGIANDKERRDLFLLIACLLEEQRDRDGDSTAIQQV